jgi:hypothetical protein
VFSEDGWRAFRQPSALGVHLRSRGTNDMSESRPAVVAVQDEAARAWVISGADFLSGVFGRTGRWFGDVAQKFAALLADLLGPAVFLAYSLTAWDMASSFGWASSFIISSGPLSNWLVWLALAIILNLAASILKRRTQNDAGAQAQE